MKHITQCFDRNLSGLYKEATALDTLSALVKRHVGDIPCEVSRFHQGKLTISVHDGVWATRLRYELPTLRDKLRSEGLHQLSSIHVSLAPEHKAHGTKKAKRKPLLSSEAKKMLRMSAEGCEYEPLKKALKRLSKHQASE